MALHPNVQRRAQAELDSINERHPQAEYPTASQLRELKYILAIMKEVLRVAPVGNLGLLDR